MSTDFSLEAFEKMPGEDEKLFYRLWSYSRVSTGAEINIDSYHKRLRPLFDEILERKIKEGLYDDCKDSYEYIICLSFEEAVKASDIMFEQLKEDNPKIEDPDLLLSVSYGAGDFIYYIEKCKTNLEARKALFEDFWITLYLD